jgi:hypothetical protein
VVLLHTAACVFTLMLLQAVAALCGCSQKDACSELVKLVKAQQWHTDAVTAKALQPILMR